MPTQQQYGQSYEPQISLKWANFLGYFAIWASVLTYISSCINVFSGNQYGGWAGAVYSFYPAMKSVDTLYALLLIGCAAFAVFAGICLLQKKKLTLTVVPLLYIVAGVVQSIYVLALVGILGTENVSGQLIATGVLTAIIEIVFFILNKIYFNKRTSIYIN